MDMSLYAGSESKYLKSSDLNGKATKVTIEGVHLVEFDDDDGNKITKPALALVDKEKQVVCNATSVQSLGQAYGFNSDNWAGKEIKLSTKHYAQLGKDGIVLTPLGVVEEMDDDIPF